jgi:hypothetical protein
MCLLIDGVIKLNADDSCHLWLCWVERNGHVDLAVLHALSLGHASMVDWNVPVVSKVEECVI